MLGIEISTDLVPLAVSKCSDKCAQNESIQCSPITADSLGLFTICYLNLIDSLRHQVVSKWVTMATLVGFFFSA